MRHFYASLLFLAAISSTSTVATSADDCAIFRKGRLEEATLHLRQFYSEGPEQTIKVWLRPEYMRLPTLALISNEKSNGSYARMKVEDGQPGPPYVVNPAEWEELVSILFNGSRDDRVERWVAISANTKIEFQDGNMKPGYVVIRTARGKLWGYQRVEVINKGPDGDKEYFVKLDPAGTIQSAIVCSPSAAPFHPICDFYEYQQPLMIYATFRRTLLPKFPRIRELSITYAKCLTRQP